MPLMTGRRRLRCERAEILMTLSRTIRKTLELAPQNNLPADDVAYLQKQLIRIHDRLETMEQKLPLRQLQTKKVKVVSIMDAIKKVQDQVHGKAPKQEDTTDEQDA